MDVTIILLAIVIFLLTRYVWDYISQPANQPNGPWQFPIFGHLLNIKRNPNWYRDLTLYRKQYGDVIRLQFGAHNAVILHGMDRIKEAFSDKADYFSERPDYQVLVKMFIGKNGLVYGKDWKSTRKLIMQSFREFGAGPKSSEEIVKTELYPLIAAFEERKGRPFDCKETMVCAVANVISTVVFGERCDYDNKEFKQVLEDLETMVSWRVLSISNFVWGTAFATMLLNSAQMLKLKTAFQGIERFINTRVNQHRETYDPENIRDFIDIHIQARGQGKTKIQENDSFAIIVDLFVAGTETTSTALRWFFAFLIHHPAVQERCYQDIVQNIGMEREATMNDKMSMVYFEATMNEILRITNIAHIGLPHVASETVEVGGYTITKGTYVLANLYDLHNDVGVWGDPEKFRPERWIDAQGKLIKNTKMAPFGIGRRSCLGEQLARTEFFLFGVTLLQRFKFKAAGSLPDMTPVDGVTLTPKPFQMILESRMED